MRLLLLLALLIVQPVNAEAPAWTLATGLFDASASEEAECYFNVGSEAVIVFHPKGASCAVARNELRGRRGRLIFQVEP